MKIIYITALCYLIGYMCNKLYKDYFRTFILTKATTELEKNPHWLSSAIKSQYYGFDDVDFIIATSVMKSAVPRMRPSKTDSSRTEVLLPVDISIRDIDEIVKLVLLGKISVKIGINVIPLFIDKSPYWLSMLCYMLEGGNVKPMLPGIEKDN